MIKYCYLIGINVVFIDDVAPAGVCLVVVHVNMYKTYLDV